MADRRRATLAAMLTLLATTADQRPGVRPDGVLGRVGAGAGRGQHRRPLRRRVHRHPDEPRRQPARSGVECLAVHACPSGSAARTARCTSRAAPRRCASGKKSIRSRVRSSRITPSGCGRSTIPTSWTAARIPSQMTPHTWGGFSTAVFEGEMLKITTTHLKEDYYRRNGVPSSDRGDAHAVLDPSRRLPDLGHDCLRPAVSHRADDSQQRIPLLAEPADSAVSVHRGRRSRRASRASCRTICRERIRS